MTNEQLVALAAKKLLAVEHVTITHPKGWERPTNWPLPAVKGKPAPDGTLTQNYRPIAILEYVNDTLVNEARAENVRNRATEDDEL